MTDSQILLESSLKFLSYRPRSRKEITDFLKKKTPDATLINQTLEKLEKLKLINDTDFAKWLVESRSRSRPRGFRLLKQELAQKGIKLDASNYTLDAETELAQKALHKKNPKSREQAIRFLQYRGFTWDTIAQVLKKAYN